MATLRNSWVRVICINHETDDVKYQAGGRLVDEKSRARSTPTDGEKGRLKQLSVGALSISMEP
jgi:hypothetical protein